LIVDGVGQSRWYMQRHHSGPFGAAGPGDGPYHIMWPGDRPGREMR
jgi:hypothetical protein